MRLKNNFSIDNKLLTLLYSEPEIEQRTHQLAQKIKSDYGEESPLIIGVLNGVFMFINTFVKAYDDFNIDISFVKYTSYEGTKSSGDVKELIGLGENIKGRSVLLVEDIVDTGLTLKTLLSKLEEFQPKNIKVVSLLLKEEALEEDVKVDYYGFKIPNLFVVGYGMDYNGRWRNIPAIYYFNEVSSER